MVIDVTALPKWSIFRKHGQKESERQTNKIPKKKRNNYEKLKNKTHKHKIKYIKWMTLAY